MQSMEFSRPEYWSGYPFPSPGDLPYPGIKPRCPALQVDSLPAEPQGNPSKSYKTWKKQFKERVYSNSGLSQERRKISNKRN